MQENIKKILEKLQRHLQKKKARSHDTPGRVIENIFELSNSQCKCRENSRKCKR